MALNKVVIENLAIVLETPSSSVAYPGAAIRWSAAVRRSPFSKDLVEYAWDLNLRWIWQNQRIYLKTTTRLSRLLEFGEANGFDIEILLAQAQSWDRPDSIIKGLIHALSIDVNCDEPLYALSGME